MRSYDKAWLDAVTPDLAKGLRGGIATLVPFFLATRLGRPEFGWMALGGWLGTLVDPGGLRSTRAKTLSTFAVVGGAALAMSEGLAKNQWLAALCLVVVAFTTSLLRSLGAVWTSAGTMLAIVTAVGTARGGDSPARDGCYFAAGAGFAVLLSSVIWPIWTHLPLRRAQANVFEALARYASAIRAGIEERLPEGDPRWVELARTHHRALRIAFEEARRLVVGGRARRSGETRIGSNLRVLLGLAEAQFPLLITLKEAVEQEGGGASNPLLLDRLRALAARDAETAATLRTPNLRAHEATMSLPPPGPAPGTVPSIDALLAHLDDASRAAQTLTCSLDARADATLENETAPERTFRDWLVLWRCDLAVLRDAASSRSTFFHHGVRIACTIGCASLIARHVAQHPHWVTVTTLAVLQPYSGATATRAAQRVLGTVIGSVAAAAITLTIHSPEWLAAVMFPLSVAAVATQRRNYRLFTFFLTPVFVLLAERFHGDWWTAVERTLDASLGGGIAFVAAVLILPSRERTRMPELLARMLDTLAEYAVAVFEARPDRHSELAEARVLAARRNTGIALSEAEGSLERLLTEPRLELSAAEFALQVVTYGRRAAGALTTIDTYAARGLLESGALPPETARMIAAYVAATLHRASAHTLGAGPGLEAPVPELQLTLDSRLRATLARLLRSAQLVADLSRGGFDHALPAGGAPPPK